MHDVTRTLIAHYDRCLAEHGPSPRGMDWGDDAARLTLRFDAICRAADLGAERPVALLDVGCGCGLLLDHLQRRAIPVNYTGLDASERMIAAARTRHAEAAWLVGDIAASTGLPIADWVVANGVLTERRDVAQDDMVRFAQTVIRRMYDQCRVGIVFNVLSSHVNYRDDTLFYWDPSEVLALAATQLSRHVAIHHDLELYEYFCVVRRVPWGAVT